MGIDEEPLSQEPDDSVRIKLGSEDAVIVESYSFDSSILRQPSAFSVQLSGGKGVKALLDKFPPGPKTRVALYIGPYRQFTGELDAANVRIESNSSTIQLKGRDMMARLHDTDITGDRSFSNATYEELFKAALDDVGQGHKVIEISNESNRKVRAGSGVKVRGEPISKAELKQGTNRTSPSFENVVNARLGETWLQFMGRQFAKIGLFSWADANGNFVLSRPNGNQDALFHFYRRRPTGAPDETPIANVKSVEYSNDTTRRFSEVVIFARNGGRKKGHNHTNGKFEDQEMVALGFNRRRVHRSVEVTNADEATFYARSKIAEANRASVKLVYTISGHTAPTMADPRTRAVIIPDTVARIDDDDLGIHDNWYIEAVEYRSPPRTTIVTLMRIQDLVFGEEQAKVGAAKAKKSGKIKVETSVSVNLKEILARQRGANNPFRDPQ